LVWKGENCFVLFLDYYSSCEIKMKICSSDLAIAHKLDPRILIKSKNYTTKKNRKLHNVFYF
jgi:hypothetical protein